MNEKGVSFLVGTKLPTLSTSHYTKCSFFFFTQLNLKVSIIRTFLISLQVFQRWSDTFLSMSYFEPFDPVLSSFSIDLYSGRLVRDSDTRRGNLKRTTTSSKPTFSSLSAGNSQYLFSILVNDRLLCLSSQS